MAAQTDLEKGIPFVPEEPLPSLDERSNDQGLGGEREPELPTESASTSEDTIATPPPEFEQPTNTDGAPKDEKPPAKPSQDADPNVVTWDGPNDPANPQNWSGKKKWIAGLGGAAPLAIGGGTIGDLFSADNRGKALSVYTLAPLTGPALGPVVGGWIAEKSSWRWIFYSTSIADAVIQLLGIVFLRETYAPKLLSIKTRQLRKTTGNPSLRSMYTKPGHIDVYDATPLQWVKIVAKGALRPLKMLVKQPIVQVFAVYQALMYGTMYLTLTTFAALWTQEYHYSVGIAGLHYIALGIGFTAGSQFGARGLDLIYKRLKARNGGVGTPEMRMPLMMFMSVLLPVGLVIYGWSAQVDHYTLHAASAIGATSSFRSLAGFGFPLFANAMFRSLGLGWGNTLLAFVAVAICIPSPYIFYHYGARIRAWSSTSGSAAAPTPKIPKANQKEPGQ
ncbi:hypothetical protein FS837_001958 [Tulasnella sp. UAMH 9824]|nr:hypothetical protein FS837_001958 [Tulasnella sp. UAMH 9824]